MVETLLKDKKLRVVIGGKAIPYFFLHEGARTDHTISAFLFILSLEFSFFQLKKIQRFKELKHLMISIYILHTPMTLTFSSKRRIHLITYQKFEVFSKFSGIKSNISKCEIVLKRGGTLKEVPVGACGLKIIDLTTDFLKIFGTFFLYNLKIKIEENLLHTISSIQRVNKLWNIRNL